MKKYLLIFAMLFYSLSVQALVLDTRISGKSEQLISEIGYRILNSNKIPTRATFYYANKKHPNAYAEYRGNTIVIFDSLVKYVEDEDMLASVIAHEIAHTVDFKKGPLKGYFSFLTMASKKSEYKADLRGVDYLVKAGYHPVAMIMLLNRITDEPRYDWYSTHPLGSKRMMEIYKYIYKKYPEYLVNNKYKDNPVYQNFLLTSRKDRQRFEKELLSNVNN